jgi:ABC-type uncharacterized transport system substrate-binding protein
MHRRGFITLLGAAAASSNLWPLASRAQQPAKPVVGFLNSASPDVQPDRLRAFRQGLSENGYEEDRNVAIEYRWAEDHFDRLPGLADDLVRRQVAVIVTGYNFAAAQAAKAATATIPIVFASGVDPVKTGLVSSLSRPGGNITGVNILTNELVPKHLEVLHEVVPAAKVIGALVNPANRQSADAMSQDAQAAADRIGLKLHIVNVTSEADFENAFATLRQVGAEALTITPDSLFSSRSSQLAALALRYAMPTISPFHAYAVAGGLMSYGGSTTDQGHQVGVYAARILKGDKPSDLPVMQTTKVELTINLKTAKTLGLTVPLPLSGRADEVIE